jgi:hypothetical protein
VGEEAITEQRLRPHFLEAELRVRVNVVSNLNGLR